MRWMMVDIIYAAASVVDSQSKTLTARRPGVVIQILNRQRQDSTVINALTD